MAEAKRDRSPSFPFIPLREALQRLEAFEQTFGRHPTPARKAGLAWSMKENSSQAFQTLAALKSFGMLQYQGSGNARVASLTDDARILIRAQQEATKKEVLRRLALNPAQIAKFWEIWGHDRPPDPVCLDDLVLKNAFTDSAARNFLRVYDETVGFAGLSNSDRAVKEHGDEDFGDLPFAVGDFVNWESSGQIQWTKARKIVAIDEHDGRLFYHVEGTEEFAGQSGWIPVEQAIEASAHDTSPKKGFAPPPPENRTAENLSPPKGMRRAVFPVSDGDVTLVFPSDMTGDGLEELGQYLDIFLKKERRERKSSEARSS